MMKKVLQYFIFIVIVSLSPLQANFLLLVGPSGTGKSTIIGHLKKIDSRFIYISPLTTRPLRENEQDKVHVELEEIRKLEKENKLLTVNKLYNTYSATPRDTIDTALQEKQFPVLDWPVTKLDVMDKNYRNKLYIVYVYPEVLNTLKSPLSNDLRDKDGKRYEAAVEELESFHSGVFDTKIHLKVLNKQSNSEEVARDIYKNFIESIKP
jgi:guanylate kinase